MTDNIPRLRTLLLHTGYAESHSYAALIVSHSKGFASAEEAFADLCACIHIRLTAQRAVRLSACCTATLEAMPKARVCATCSKRLTAARPVTNEDVGEFLREHLSAECDGTASLDDYLKARGWTLGEIADRGGLAEITSADYLVDGRGCAVIGTVQVGRGGYPREDVKRKPLALPTRPAIDPGTADEAGDDE